MQLNLFDTVFDVSKTLGIVYTYKHIRTTGGIDRAWNFDCIRVIRVKCCLIRRKVGKFLSRYSILNILNALNISNGISSF